MRAGAIEPEKERRTHPTVQMVLAGVRRFTLFALGAAALAGGLGLLFGYLQDSDLARSLTLGLYIGGALLIGFAAFTFSSQPRQWVGELGEDLGPGAGGSEAGALVAIGLALVGLGLLFEWLLL